MPRWRVIVSRIGVVPTDWRNDRVLDRSGCVYEAIVNATDESPGAAEAFRAAAEMIHAQGDTLSPLHLQVHLEDGDHELVVLSDYVHARLEWPFPAFFWSWLDRFSTETRARLDPMTTASVLEPLAKWAELGKKIRLVLDDERRAEIRHLVLSLLPVVPGLGLQQVDMDELYFGIARVAWLAAQPDMVLTPDRQRTLDVVLSALSALVQPAR